jgi:hypothetical protein
MLSPFSGLKNAAAEVISAKMSLNYPYWRVKRNVVNQNHRKAGDANLSEPVQPMVSGHEDNRLPLTNAED